MCVSRPSPAKKVARVRTTNGAVYRRAGVSSDVRESRLCVECPAASARLSERGRELCRRLPSIVCSLALALSPQRQRARRYRSITTLFYLSHQCLLLLLGDRTSQSQRTHRARNCGSLSNAAQRGGCHGQRPHVCPLRPSGQRPVACASERARRAARGNRASPATSRE